MSPEQIEDAAAVTAATDVYSLGLVIYELAAGRSPFTAKSAPEYLLAHVRDEPLDLRVAAPGPAGGAGANGVMDSVAAVVMACLAKDPAARPTAAELARRLAAAADEAGAPPASEIVRRDIESASEIPVAATALAPTMAAPSRS
jgi:serine/threonine-protein kinase